MCLNRIKQLKHICPRKLILNLSDHFSNVIVHTTHYSSETIYQQLLVSFQLSKCLRLKRNSGLKRNGLHISRLFNHWCRSHIILLRLNIYPLPIYRIRINNRSRIVIWIHYTRRNKKNVKKKKQSHKKKKELRFKNQFALILINIKPITILILNSKNIPIGNPYFTIKFFRKYIINFRCHSHYCLKSHP
jgi:hypothetical protein